MKMITYICSFLVLTSTFFIANHLYSQPSTVQEKSITIKVADDPKLGKILTDSKGMTLYMFTADTKDTSNCYDKCAVNWPPLLVSSGKPTLAPGVAGTVGTINRQDKTSQVTYNGMPLYYYEKDKKPGDVSGQNVNNKWFVINPK